MKPLTLSQKLRILRQLHAMTQKELADQVGISQQMIAYYEKDEYKPTTKIMGRLSKVLKYNLSRENSQCPVCGVTH